MSHTFIETSVEIEAPASTVWGMFTDPAFTKQMGGEYVSNWKVGSPLKWLNSAGQILTNGTILKIEPNKILQHSLFSNPESLSVMAILTYKLVGSGDRTTVRIREDFTNSITEEERVDFIQGWNVALRAAKEVGEKINNN